MLIILVNQNTILVKLVSIISRYVSVYQAKIPVREGVIGASETLVAFVYAPEKKRIVELTVIECFKRLCYDGVPPELPSLLFVGASTDRDQGKIWAQNCLNE
jgi:hypothetical protein